MARLHESSSADQPKLVDKPKDQEFCYKPPGNVFISIMDNCPVIIKRKSNMYEVNVLCETADFFMDPLPFRIIFNFLVTGPGRNEMMTGEEFMNKQLIRAIMLQSNSQCLIQAILHDWMQYCLFDLNLYSLPKEGYRM